MRLLWGSPSGSNGVCEDRRLADQDARVVHVEVGAGVDPPGEGLHDEAAALLGHDVEDDVEVEARVAVPHEDLEEDGPAARGGGSRGGERRALVEAVGHGQLVLGREEGPAGDGARRHREGVLHLAQVDRGVHRHDVDEVHLAPVDLGPRGGRPVRDALHLLEELGVVAAEHEGVGESAQGAPAVGRVLRVAPDRELLDVGGDLLGDELAELPAPGVGCPFHVDVDPAPVLVAEGRPLPAHALEGDDFGDVPDLGQRHVVEEGPPGGRAVAAELQLDPVGRSGGDEGRLDARPVPCAADGGGVIGEREGGHRDRRRDGGGVAGQWVGHGALRLHPRGQAVDVPDPEGHRLRDDTQRRGRVRAELDRRPAAAAVGPPHGGAGRRRAVERPARGQGRGAGRLEARVRDGHRRVGRGGEGERGRREQGGAEYRAKQEQQAHPAILPGCTVIPRSSVRVGRRGIRSPGGFLVARRGRGSSERHPVRVLTSSSCHDLVHPRQQAVRPPGALRRGLLPAQPRREGRPRRPERGRQDDALPHDRGRGGARTRARSRSRRSSRSATSARTSRRCRAAPCSTRRSRAAAGWATSTTSSRPCSTR